MRNWLKCLGVAWALSLVACTDSQINPGIAAQPATTIFSAQTILTLNSDAPTAEAVAVREGRILAVGTREDMHQQFADAHWNSHWDESFADKVLVPGLIDPHVHMILGAMMYAKPFAPPWDVQTPEGVVKGLPDRPAFLERIAQIEQDHPGEAPLVIYGYHNLVHGTLDRHDLDAITQDRPLIIWHYSGHDFYLNTKALAYANVDASWADEFEGVPLDADGQPTGRVYEDAVLKFLTNVGHLFLAPQDIQRGFDGFETMLAASGVTSVAELGYGLFGLRVEDNYYKAFYGDDFHTRVYLVPEHRAFAKAFGDTRIDEIKSRVADTSESWPRVLPQIKLFTDAAFYSQTMRLQDPGYTGGQSKGEHGLWVTGPDVLADTMRPYWQAGLDIRIHSNGDAAQDNTLNAFETVKSELDTGRRLVIEHAGLMRPEHIAKAKQLGIGISAASHYVHYMGEDYERAIGDRVQYMTPLASSFRAGLPTTLHSDAPLAPPSPLIAASVHILRSTRQGGVSTPSERLTPEQALRTITLDAAWAMGLESEIGSIEVGKLADFTVLDANPLTTPAQDWPTIKIWGVVLNGDKKPVEQEK
ncbi:MAG: hypothetical protein COA69_10035 [Robiginitomaculum sp.]|nr:MAG: hypothetical protein COA69_10035 [Robiginitomaculum sp.]